MNDSQLGFISMNKKTLPVQTDMEKMTGKVGDYITLEEILS